MRITENFSTTTYKDVGIIIQNSNYDWEFEISYTEGYYRVGQSINGMGDYLKQIKFYANKYPITPNDDYTIIAKVYAHSGIYGTSSVPTGIALSTSINTITSATDMVSGNNILTFNFDGSLFLTNNTKYVITLEFSRLPYDGENGFDVNSDINNGHAGNGCTYNGSSWSAHDWLDLKFYLNAYGPTADWNITQGKLLLYGTSPNIDITNNIGKSLKLNTTIYDILGAQLSKIDSTPVGTSIDYQLSNDGSITWETVIPDEWHNFSSTGNDLRFKITLNGIATETPFVDSITVIYVFNNPIIQPKQKKYTFKIYKSNGSYITSWADASFDGFKKTINGGLGECKIKLARKFDDFGENDDVKLNNKVEIICSDGDTPSTGTKIYSGFISNYTPFIDGNSEGVEITCLGYVSKLGTSILKNGSQIELKTDTASGLTTGATASAVEVRDVVMAIIDRYRAEAVNPIINYLSTSTEDSGNTFTYTFNAKKYNEALDICKQYAPANWWWFVGVDNILEFKPKPNLADHKFVFGKHFESIKVEKNMENVVNRVLFSSGDNTTKILKLYSDTDSSDLYDDRWEIITDNRVSVSETADNAGESTLAEKKNADVKTTIEILDNNGNPNGYDIESINPGDTCKFLNLNTITSQTFSGNMTIQSVSYMPDKVVIEVELLSISAGKEIIKNTQRIEDQEASGRETTYTT